MDGVFKKLNDFGFQRDWKQAVGFFLVYFGGLLLANFVIALVLTPVLLHFGGVRGAKAAVTGLAALVTMIVSAFLAHRIIEAKNMKSFRDHLQVFLIFILSGFFGVVSFALIAHLTTKPVLHPQLSDHENIAD